MNKKDSYYWKRLDNVAAFYASVTTTYNPYVYRLSVKLKEKIVLDKLTKALDDTLLAIPSFMVKLRKGFFWYYLEENNKKTIIMEDDHFATRPINNIQNNYFLFKVTYFEKRINVDFSHILTDGIGALDFLKTLVINYLKQKHPKKISKTIISETEMVSLNEMSDDSFLKYFKMANDEGKESVRKDNIKAFKLKNKKKKDLIDVIVGTMSVNELKPITKTKNVTITAYLTALLIYSIYHGNYKYADSKAPISIAVPVNLRNFFPSSSMNNFFSTIIISLDVMKKDYSFDDVLEIVSLKMKEELDESSLLNNFRSFVKLHSNLILRFIPIFIKDIVLRNINRWVSKKGSTSSLSNLGIIHMPDEVKQYVDKFDMISYTDISTSMKIGICSFNDTLSVSFSSGLNDTEVERIFFTSLTNNGIKVNISSSLTVSRRQSK